MYIHFQKEIFRNIYLKLMVSRVVFIYFFLIANMHWSMLKPLFQKSLYSLHYKHESWPNSSFHFQNLPKLPKYSIQISLFNHKTGNNSLSESTHTQKMLGYFFYPDAELSCFFFFSSIGFFLCYPAIGLLAGSVPNYTTLPLPPMKHPSACLLQPSHWISQSAGFSSSSGESGSQHHLIGALLQWNKEFVSNSGDSRTVDSRTAVAVLIL